MNWEIRIDIHALLRVKQIASGNLQYSKGRALDDLEGWDGAGKKVQEGVDTCTQKGDQSWVSTGRTDVEAETPILWPPHAKS